MMTEQSAAAIYPLILSSNMKLSLDILLPILLLISHVNASSKVISPSPPTSSDTPFVKGRTFIDGESKVANTQLADVYGCCTSTSLSADGKYMFIMCK